MIRFRELHTDEIECRVQSVKKNGCVLLLYKDARCDMNMLDEIVGSENWTRTHEVINGSLFCTVGIYIEGRREWVYKQDVGTKSNTEEEKGQASDSFKRACFNWGIGRELYTAPFTWVNLEESEVKEKQVNGKPVYYTYTTFSVSEIAYNDRREIIKLTIVDNKGKVRFTIGAAHKAYVPTNTAPDNTPVSQVEEVAPPPEATKAPEQTVKVISKAQVNRLYAIAKGKGYSNDEVNTCIFKKIGKRTVDLIKAEYDEFVKGYENGKTKEELEAAKAAKVG